MAQSYGYTGYYKPPKTPRPPARSLASAAAGRTTSSDPFGLLTDTTDSARVARQNATPHAGGVTVIQKRTDGGVSGPGFGGTDIGIPPGYPGAAAVAAQTPIPSGRAAYDINTDPALQLTNALTGMSDEQAQAEAQKQADNQLLGYGDANLVRKLRGADSPLAQAAAANPTSTLAQFGQQRERNVHDMTEGYNRNNLLYSGARVVGEQQAAQDYQNALAQAAAGVNTNLDTISGNLSGTLAQNEAQRLAAMDAAYGRHALDFGAAGYGDGTGLDGVVIPPIDQAAAGGGDQGSIGSGFTNPEEFARLLGNYRARLQ